MLKGRLSASSFVQADSEKEKSLKVLSQQRAKNIQIMINRFPAARHVKTAILGMDHSFFTMEIIEVSGALIIAPVSFKHPQCVNVVVE